MKICGKITVELDGLSYEKPIYLSSCAMKCLKEEQIPRERAYQAYKVAKECLTDALIGYVEKGEK